MRARKPCTAEGTQTKNGVRGTCATSYPPPCPLHSEPRLLPATGLKLGSAGTAQGDRFGKFSLCNQQSANLSCFNSKARGC